MIATIHIIGARSSIEKIIMKACCTWLMSLVVRVMSEAVLNFSKSEVLKVRTLANTAALRSLENPAPTLALKNDDEIAPMMINTE